MKETEKYATIKWFIDQFVDYVDDNDIDITKWMLEPHIEPFITELLAKTK